MFHHNGLMLHWPPHVDRLATSPTPESLPSYGNSWAPLIIMFSQQHVLQQTVAGTNKHIIQVPFESFRPFPSSRADHRILQL